MKSWGLAVSLCLLECATGQYIEVSRPSFAQTAISTLIRPGSRGPSTHYAPTSRPTPRVVRDVTDSRLWPAPALESHANNEVWTFLGGPGVAAVGTDCIFLGRSASTENLTMCEQSCANDGSCNVVNWDPSIPDCVLRACTDPLHPILSPYSGYSVYGTVKATYVLDSSAFTLEAVGYTDEVLIEAMGRYASMMFVYGPGNASEAGSGAVLVPGLRIQVTAYAPLDDSTDESYNLTAPDGAAGGYATLAAGTVYGALRGLETFSQLLSYNLSNTVYSLVYTAIQDAPRFPFRGVLVDTSRHFITPLALKLIMDQMSYLKLNVMHLHLTDDQSWPLQLTSFPLLATMAAYSNFSHSYSHADVSDLVHYAGMRGIRLIPEFDSPSHFGSLFAAYPQYAAVSYDKTNTSYLCMVDISREETFSFLAAIWAEILSLFPDSHTFIGGDEFWGCWNESPVVSSWMAARNYTITDAYYYYERRLIDIVRAQGKKPMAWLDIAGFPHNFTTAGYANYTDVTLNVWTGCYSGNWQDDTAQFVHQNMNVVVSGPYYITQQNGAPTTPHFTWQDMYSIDLFNFTGGSNETLRKLVRGGEVCAWDDAAQTDSGDLWMSLTPYLIGVAEAWWSPQSITSGVTPDEGRAHASRCRMGARGIPSHPIYAFGSYCPFEYEPRLSTWE